MKDFEDIAKGTTAQKTTGTIYGFLGNDFQGQPIVFSRNPDAQYLNENVMVFGTNHKDITSCYSINYILQAIRRKESIIVTESSDECYDATAAYAKEQGYTVRRLNLSDFSKSDSWDILNTCIHDQAPLLDAMLLSQAFIHNEPGKEESDIYLQAAQEMLTTLFLRVYLGSDFGEKPGSLKISNFPVDPRRLGYDYIGEKNLASIHEILDHPEGAYFFNELTSPEVLMRTSSEQARCPLSDASPGFISNIFVNLRIRLRFLYFEKIRKLLSTEGIGLTLPGKEPCLYFCKLDPELGTYNNIGNLFISMLMNELYDLAILNDDQRLKVPVNFLLDDIRALGSLIHWDRRLSMVNSVGIKISMIAQDPIILEEVYGHSITPALMNNCETWINYGGSSLDSSDILISRMNQALFNMGAKHPYRDGKKAQPLINKKDLQFLKHDDIIVSFCRHPSVILKKFPYTKHPDFEKLHK